MDTDPVAEPDAQKGEPTETEIRSALEALRTPGLPAQRAAAAAKQLLRYHPSLAAQLEPADLISMATIAILEGRRDWDRSRVDFLGFFVGVMRSLAFNEARKAQQTQPRYLPESQLQSEASDHGEGVLASMRSDSPSPEEQLLESEARADRDGLLAIVRASLSDDADVRRVLELELEGVPKKRIREQLGLDDKRFWAIDRRITRAFDAAVKWRNSHD